MGPHPTFSKLKRLALRQKEITTDTRSVHCGAPERNLKKGFAKNAIHTTKYNFLSFLPKGLFEQFRRVANIYFLFHAGLSLTPITPVNPVTTIVPLVFVIGVAMVKEGIEDLKRGRSDKKVNGTLVDVVLGPGKVEARRWKDVRVGDIVRVTRDSSFPGDLVFLGSSDPEGVGFVETMNLDGETNLKVRNAVEQTRGLYPEGFGGFDGTVECEQPNPSLYTFAGTLNWRGEGIPLGPENILLRGSDLRNTAEVYGAVIFTGHDTKIMMNATSPPSKRSFIERRLDYVILGQMALLFLMSLLTAIWFGVRLSNEMQEQWYLRPDDTTGTNAVSSAQFNWRHPWMAGFLQFFTALVLYGYFVPISLYVSIEVTRIIQAAFINQDVRMYHEESNKPTRARTSNLNEELGMIQTILSDKTGTLTRNQMDFFKCSIAGVSYGKGVTEVERAAADLLGRSVSKEELDQPPDAPLEKGFNLRDQRLTNQGWFREQRPEVIRRFMEILAVCHTVIPEGDADPDRIKYMAESPDEAAFVTAAKRFGFFFHKRTGSGQTGFMYITESLPGGQSRELRYELLNILEFSSKRRRMSVIVRDPEGKLLLLSKGAETIMFDLLAPNDQAKEFRRVTEDHIDQYAEAGLRTLALGYRELDASEYQTWQVRWRSAKEDVRSAAEIAKRLGALSDEIERDLILVGATAIEDKLQVGVPQTIDKLAKAGIKLWVLTGDKMETAINIGYACSLLRHNMGKHIITLDDPDVRAAEATKDQAKIKQASVACVLRQIADALDVLRSGAAAEAVGIDESGTLSSHGLIIDGKSLLYIFEDEGAKAGFLQLAMLCDSVICCRVSPKQKSQVTLLVKNDAKETCLSVGDGANDVGMIQAANVGVGISGFEGQQAVMASDFAIAQFRFLERLVLVHGGWSYKRICRMITYFFYKNFLFGFTVFFFNGYAMFSGQSIYHDWYLSLFNVVFTSIPIGVVACIDQDVSPRYRLQYPVLYGPGQRNKDFSWFRIVAWMFNGLLQAIILFWFTMGYYKGQSDQGNGKVPDLYAEGTTMFTAVVFIANLQLAVIIQYWTWIHHFTIWGSIVVYICFLLVLSAFPVEWSGEGAGIFQGIVAKAPSFYILVLLLIVAALLPDFVMRSYLWMRHPEDTNIVQEIAYKARKRRLAMPYGTSEAQEAPSALPPSRGHFRASLLGRKRQSFEQQRSFELRQQHSPIPKVKKIVLPNGALTRERSSNGRIEDISGHEHVGNGSDGYMSDGHGIVEMQPYR